MSGDDEATASPDVTSADQAARTGPLDEHRDFVLGIDDASRRGHSLLGGGALVAVVVVLLVTDTALWSLTTLWLAPLSLLVALILGRRLGLARQDGRLRQRVLRYCEREGLVAGELVDAARRSGRYDFFVKLFGVPAAGRDAAVSAAREVGAEQE